VRKIFPYLTCTRNIDGNDDRACLYYHIGRCAAPCIGAVNLAEYRQIIDNLCDFLGGNTEPVVADLRRQMEAASEGLVLSEQPSCAINPLSTRCGKAKWLMPILG
jgi:excinuclease ABC subunit C